MTLKYRADVDGLRALAIFLVVWFHASPREIPGGYIGVDVFFVISGYLISGIILRELRSGSFSVRDFYVRRFRRIVPALATVLISVWALGWFALFSWEYAELGKQMAASAGFIANMLFWQEAGYFDVTAEMKPLLHLWSLGVEEQFYLFWPLILMFSFHKRWNIWTLLLALMGVSFALNIAFIQQYSSAVFYLLPTRLWELLAGASLAYLEIFRPGAIAAFGRRLPARIAPHYENLRALLGFGLIVFASLSLKKSSLFPGWWALAPVIGAWLLISSPQAWINRKIFATRVAVYLGQISYPLYLWHWPLISMTHILENGEPSHRIRNQAVLIALVLSVLTYKGIEPWFRKSPPGPKRYGRVFGTTFAVLGSLLVLGIWTSSNGGFPQRLESLESARNDGLENTGLKTFDGKAPSLENQLWPSNIGGDCPVESKEFDARLCPGPGSAVAMVGDSHGDHWTPGLLALKDTPLSHLLFVNRWKAGGCPPLLGMRSYNDKDIKDPEKCIRFQSGWIEHVAEDERIKTVLLASRGPLYVHGRGFGIERFTWEIEDAKNPALKHGPALLEGYVRTIDRMLAAGKRIVFLVDTPELGFEATSCILRRPLTLAPQPESFDLCAVPRTVVDARQKDYRVIIASLQKKYPQVLFVDPTPLLCDTEYCYAKKDGHLLYRDDDHLSLFGSTTLMKQLAPQILEWLESSAP